MSTHPGWSSRVYSKLLRLYPEDLRRDFGTEMALVFAEDLAEAWSERGVRGAIGVWRRALGEIVPVALLSRASEAEIAVPALSFALSVITHGAQLMLALEQVSRLEVAILNIVMLPSIAAAAISMVAIRAGRGSVAPLILR